jgi:hypothetical protein
MLCQVSKKGAISSRLHHELKFVRGCCHSLARLARTLPDSELNPLLVTPVPRQHSSSTQASLIDKHE